MIASRSQIGRQCGTWPLCSVLILMATASLAMEPPDMATKTYDFKVLLDNHEIGRQRFDVSSNGTQTRIHVQADFKVTFLLITVYTYHHTNQETWEGSCLRSIEAETNDNGDRFFVKGSVQDSRLVWRTHAGKRTAADCIKTYAYWNPNWLSGDRLLNSQTGELDRADIRDIGEETIPVHGTPTPTTHRRIVTDKFTIDLWYTLSGEWVALQSTTKEGKTLHYMLQ